MPQLAEAVELYEVDPGIAGSRSTTNPHISNYRKFLASARQSQWWQAELLMRHFQNLDSRINQLRHLRQGWDSYGSEPPSEESSNHAHRILNALQQAHLTPTSVVPSAEGGVGIYFVRDGGYADIECLNAGEILAVAYKENERSVVWEIIPTDSGIRDGVARLKDYLAA